MRNDIMHIQSGLFEPQLREIMQSLPAWKKERPHGPKAVQSTHDTAALTSTCLSEQRPLQADIAVALSWLSVELSDVHAVATFPYIIPFLHVVYLSK